MEEGPLSNLRQSQERRRMHRGGKMRRLLERTRVWGWFPNCLFAQQVATLLRVVFTAWLLTGVLGCKSTPAEHTYPNDPLLISKKPIERNPEATRTVLVAYHEPPGPPSPLDALVAKPSSPDS